MVAPAASLHSVKVLLLSFLYSMRQNKFKTSLVSTLIPGTFSSCVLAYTISSQRFDVLLQRTMGCSVPLSTDLKCRRV